MTVKEMADTPQEGEITFEGMGDDTSTDSPTGTNDTDDNQDQGDDQDDSDDGQKHDEEDDNVPFHKHPAWLRREKEWQDRFNSQETRHQDDIKGIREEFGAARKENAEDTQIPSWFGGSQEQWNQYREFNDKQIKEAEERAIKRLTEEKSAETKAVEEATTFMQEEIAFIETDKTINPTGTKVDPNKLLKIVMDNDLVDSKGKWNYRAGWRILQSMKPTSTPNNNERKVIAGASSTHTQSGEVKPQAFKTTADFKKNKPW